MLERIEQVAKDDDRTLVLTDTKLPFDERETHGYRQFADACGFELSNYEVVRHLALPVPDDAASRSGSTRPPPRHEGYTIETFVDDVPDDLVESLCVLLGQLAVDAPTGAVDFEEEVMTPERFAENVATVRGDGPGALRDPRAHARPARSPRSRPSSCPLGEQHRPSSSGAPSCTASTAATSSAWPPRRPTCARCRPFRDDLKLVTTQNAETNDYMVSINERMGFEPVEVSAEFVKHL